MAGLLDMFEDPNQAAMFKLATGLLSAGGPSARPVSLGQAFGSAGNDAMGAYQQAKEQQFQGLQRQLQMQEIARKQAAQKAQQEALSRLPPEVQQAVMAGVPYADIWKRDNPEAKFETVFTPEGREQKAFVSPKGVVPVGGTKQEQMPWEYEMGPNGLQMKPAVLAAAKEKARAGKSDVNVSYGAPVAGIDPAGSPVFFQPSKTGGQPSIVPGVKPPDVDKLTESQAKASAFLGQMRSAEDRLAQVPIDQTKFGAQIETAAAGTPLNALTTPAAQQAKQAQSQWAEAYLRFKTGAAATKDEVDLNVKTFFPQFGDRAEVIAQKAQMRQQAMNDMTIAAGKGAGKVTSVYGNNAPAPLPASPSASNLKKNQVYDTPKGLLRWNGMKFETIGDQ